VLVILRRLFWLGLIFFAFLLLVESCGNEQMTRQDEPTTKEAPPFTYTLKMTTKTAERLAITYPQIVQSNDLSKQQRINQIIERKALGYTEGYTEAEKQNMEWEIESDVHFEGQRMLSISFKGLIGSSDWAHPGNVFDVLNLDLKDERVVKLSELLTLDERLLALIRTKMGELEKKSEQVSTAENYILEQTDEILLQQLRDQQTDNYFFDESQLTLIFDTFHAIGSYAFVEFEHAQLQAQRAIGDNRWQMLMKAKR
jgi:hypothetical protein